MWHIHVHMKPCACMEACFLGRKFESESSELDILAVLDSGELLHREKKQSAHLITAYLWHQSVELPVEPGLGWAGLGRARLGWRQEQLQLLLLLMQIESIPQRKLLFISEPCKCAAFQR